MLFELWRNLLRPKVCHYPLFPRFNCDCLLICKFPPGNTPCIIIKKQQKPRKLEKS